MNRMFKKMNCGFLALKGWTLVPFSDWGACGLGGGTQGMSVVPRGTDLP